MLRQTNHIYRVLVLFIGSVLLIVLGCRPIPIVDAEMAMSPTPTSTLYTSPLLYPRTTPTASPTSTATPTTTPYPTIVIPMLTPTITPTLTPSPTPTSPPPSLGLPEQVIPEPFGVEIHFVEPDLKEVDLLETEGFRFIRMDLFWVDIERERGHYEFGAYDTLVRTMRERGIRIVFILDYGNPLYDEGHSPRTAETRAAFARFAAVAARRYRGNDIIWEIWNEPNLAKFWSPSPNATHYGQLVLAAARAIRRVDATAWIIGPATSGFDWPVWTEMAEMGALKYFDAVSVHPYRFGLPETALEDYIQLRGFLHHYSPEWRIPIVSGEWGYASTLGGYSDVQQAWFISRQWLFNMAHDVKLSIWYDWRNDGYVPTDPEHNYGTVDANLDLKPAYYAAQTLIKTLRGYRFLRRIPMENPHDYGLLFQKEHDLALAIWNPYASHHVALPLPLEAVQVVDLMGERSEILAGPEGITVELGPAPHYLLLGREVTADLGRWWPVHTINVVELKRNPALPIMVQNPFPEVQAMTFEVVAEGQILGTMSARVPPGEEKMLAIPLEREKLLLDEGIASKDVSARVVSRLAREELGPLRSALVWLHIVR